MPNINRTRLHVADAVLAVISAIDRYHGDEYEPYVLGAFANGREHGYTLRCGERIAAFAEVRNGDGIVVYTATGWDLEFPIDDVSPSDTTHFKQDQVVQAARAVQKFLGVLPAREGR